MSQDSSTLEDILESLSVGAKAAAPFLGATGGAILNIVSTTLESAAAIAKAGGDPVLEIQRIHQADPYVRRVKQNWKERLDKRFPEDE